MDGTARALLGRLCSNELQSDPAHPGPARVRTGEIDVALVADLALQRHLRSAGRRGEGHADPGPKRERLPGFDEHPGIRDVSPDAAGDSAIALEKDRKRLVELADRDGGLQFRLYFFRTAGHAPNALPLG